MVRPDEIDPDHCYVSPDGRFILDRDGNPIMSMDEYLNYKVNEARNENMAMGAPEAPPGDVYGMARRGISPPLPDQFYQELIKLNVQDPITREVLIPKRVQRVWCLFTSVAQMLSSGTVSSRQDADRVRAMIQEVILSAIMDDEYMDEKPYPEEETQFSLMDEVGMQLIAEAIASKSFTNAPDGENLIRLILKEFKNVKEEVIMPREQKPGAVKSLLNIFRKKERAY